MGGAKMAVAYDPTKQYEIKSWDVAYRHDPARTLLARIYQPQGDGPFPALLDVHGGAWNGQDRTANEIVDQGLAESGILGPEDVARLERAGAFAFLVGESLMRERDPGLALRRLLGTP